MKVVKKTVLRIVCDDYEQCSLVAKMLDLVLSANENAFKYVAYSKDHEIEVVLSDEGEAKAFSLFIEGLDCLIDPMPF